MCFPSRPRGIAVLILFSIFASSSASAHFRPEVHREFGKLQQAVSRIENDEVGGIRGSVAVTLGGLLRSLHFRGWEYNDSTYFESDGSPLEMAVSRTGRRVSPLVVFFPGVFGDARSGGALMVGRQARRTRNHVLILPNPWGSNFQSAYPKFMPGDFEREALVMVDMVAEGVRRIGSERVSGIHFVGESYGGFLAATTALYAIEQGRFAVDSVFSIAVPFHVGNAIGSIDKMADEHEEAYFDKGCGTLMHSFTRTVGFVFELMSNRRAKEVYSKSKAECSKAVFAFVGFQQPLFDLAGKLQIRIPSEEWKNRTPTEWRKKIRFRDFGRIFFGQDVKEIVSKDSATLHYWVSRLRDRGVKTLALVAKNDPLNPPPGIGSKEVIAAYPPEDILVLEKGGHLGWRASKAYKQVLRAQFRSPTASFNAQNSDEYESVAHDEDLDNSLSASADGIEEEV